MQEDLNLIKNEAEIIFDLWIWEVFFAIFSQIDCFFLSEFL